MAVELDRLFASMDYLLLERVEGDEFQVASLPPAWTGNVLEGGFERGSVLRPSYHFPVLDVFFPDAEEVWDADGPARAECDTWLQTGENGEQLALSALALRFEGQALLLVKNLGERYERQVVTLQMAREHLLHNEKLESEVRRKGILVRQREEELAMKLLVASGWRDQETGAHVERIGLYSAALVKAMGWDEAAQKDMRLAACMHDIGKIGIPDAILKKPGKLETMEWSVMETHTSIGESMLGHLDFPMMQMARDIAIGHHEKWDGEGYPYQRSGEEIPLPARIVAIVDVYDALSHARVYKPAFPEEKVLTILEEGRGNHFDPKLLDLFFDLLPKMREIRSAAKG
jgi:HD-GYP domain-containing protein (c-di-GMP phosphodiesterase class II)